MKNLFKKLTDFVAPPQATIADTEIQTCMNAVERLEALAEFHQSLANQYRLGVARIRSAATVSVNVNKDTPANQEVRQNLQSSFARGGMLTPNTLGALSKEA